MFFDLAEFCRSLLARRPALGLVTWTTQPAIKSLPARLRGGFHKASPGARVSHIDASQLDEASFEVKLITAFAGKSIAERCLLVYGIEPLTSAAARMLNGYRERLGSFLAVVIVIREDRRRDFILDCPDLMDWIGANEARAEALGPPLTLRDVDASILGLEKRFHMTTEEFCAKRDRGELGSSDDYWFWSELLAVRSSIVAARHQ